MSSDDPLGPIEPLPPEEPPLVHPFEYVPQRPTRPPHPNFWWTILWCIGFDAFIFGTLIAVLIVTILAASLLAPDQRAFLSGLRGCSK